MVKLDSLKGLLSQQILSRETGMKTRQAQPTLHETHSDSKSPTGLTKRQALGSYLAENSLKMQVTHSKTFSLATESTGWDDCTMRRIVLPAGLGLQPDI